MQLILISSPQDVANEAAIINGLFGMGLSRFHLRKPDASDGQVFALLDRIDPAFYSRISLHQHHEMAPAYGINRLHYTEYALKHTALAALASQNSNGYKLTTSVHDVQLISCLSAFEYVFYGPVFDSLSKPGYKSAIQPGFTLDKRWERPEVVALGGIDQCHLKAVKAMGFDGAAVLGAIWNQPEKAPQIFEQLQAICLCNGITHD